MSFNMNAINKGVTEAIEDIEHSGPFVFYDELTFALGAVTVDEGGMKTVTNLFIKYPVDADEYEQYLVEFNDEFKCSLLDELIGQANREIKH